MSLSQAGRPLSAPSPVGAGDTRRDQVLQLIMAQGPVTVAELAAQLDLTTAAIRRHISGLETSGLVEVYDGGHTGGRGRPARRFVATVRAQTSLSGGYSDLAVDALRFLAAEGGEEAVSRFANSRLAELEERYRDRVTAPEVAQRVEQLAQALAEDGYAASARPATGPGGTPTLQLCQGHCPVQHVAAQFPQLCEAEAQAFSRLIGSHVQRLATLASGGHACTTNVPVTAVRTTVDLPEPRVNMGPSGGLNRPNPTPSHISGPWKEENECTN